MSHLVLGLSSDTEANACNERQTSCAVWRYVGETSCPQGTELRSLEWLGGVTVWGIKPQPAITSPELALAPDVPPSIHTTVHIEASQESGWTLFAIGPAALAWDENDLGFALRLVSYCFILVRNIFLRERVLGWM